jgi:disulfide bond formation protein DsbB
MLKDFGETLRPEELDQLVAYLSGEVSLAERLAHPGVHLVFLILLFNGGVLWAARKAESLGDDSGAGESPGTKSRSGWLVVLAAGVLIGGIYLALGDRDAEPPVDELIEPTPTATTSSTKAEVTPETPLAAAEPDGAALYKVTCPACHGQDAKGMQGLGKDMTTSEFIKKLSDQELVEFIKKGRALDDPLNTTGVAMPPKGLNVALSDDDILAIVKFIRSLSE